MMSLTRAAFRYKAFKRSPLPLRIKSFGEGDTISSKIFDISTSGISFVVPTTKEVPQIGENIKVDFTLMDYARISCVGKVTRQQAMRGLQNPQVKIGIQFFELPVRYRLAIKKAIDHATLEDMLLLNKHVTVPAELAERRSSLLRRSGNTWDGHSQNDILKIALIFFIFAAGVYVLDLKSEVLSGKANPPAWSTKAFKGRIENKNSN